MRDPVSAELYSYHGISGCFYIIISPKEEFSLPSKLLSSSVLVLVLEFCLIQMRTSGVYIVS